MLAKLLIQHGNDQAAPVISGCPFPAARELGDGAWVSGADGNQRFAQAFPLTGAMVNGGRWWELSFLSDWEGAVTVAPVTEGDSTKVPKTDIAAETGAGIELDNGLVRVCLATDTSAAPVSVSWGSGGGSFVPELQALELGACTEVPGARRELRVLRNGPLRAQAELQGRLQGQGGWFDYRLTLELWRDCPALKLDWLLLHNSPGLPEIKVTAAVLRGQWQVGAVPERVFRQKAHGLGWQPRDVVNPAPVTLIADETMAGVHAAAPAMLLDDTEYPFYCAPPVIPTGDWLELRGAEARVSAQVVDFARTQPNALVSAGTELSYAFVPTGVELCWCQGWRKEQTLLFSFAARSDALAPAALAAAASRVFASGRAQPAPETLLEHKCFELERHLPYIPGRNLRLSSLLDQLCHLNSRAGKFDLGDTPDWHYTRGYATGPNQYMPLGPFKDFPRSTSQSGYVFPDTLKYFLEPVWTNNEYDMIHALATEGLRTGKDEHFSMLRWAARHNVEIDFLSYSDDEWHHRASPFHSHFHNRKGAITSHFWTQGLLQYYCLTGDRDALETARALGDKIIQVNNNVTVRQWKFDREIGWALLALCCLVEAGESGYLAEARRIAGFLRGFDRGSFSGAVKLSNGRAGRGLERQMIDNGFGYASMIEALDRYCSLENDDGFSAWFKELLYDLKAAFWEKIEDGEPVSIRSMIGLVMTIGFERTGDRDFLLAGRLILERWLDLTHANPTDISMAAGTEAGNAKPCAMSYRGLHRLLGALHRNGELEVYEYPALREHRAAVPG